MSDERGGRRVFPDPYDSAEELGRPGGAEPRSAPASGAGEAPPPPGVGAGSAERATGGFAPVSVPEDLFDRRTGSIGPGRATLASLAKFDSELLAPLFFSVLLLGTGAGLLYVLSPFVADLVMAFITVGLVSGGYEWLRRHGVRSAWLASGVTTLLVALTAVLPIVGLIWSTATEAASLLHKPAVLADQLSTLLDRVVVLARAFGLPVTSASLQGYLDEAVGMLRGRAISIGSSVLSNVLELTVHLATVLVMVFYILVDGHRLRRFLFDLSPLPDEEDALLEDTFRKVARGVVVGQGLGSAVQGVLGGLSFWAVGLPSPILWGTIMAVFAFLPLIGVTAVAVPGGLYLVATGKPLLGLGFIAFNALQGAIIENIVKTKLLGSAMRMHDLLVFLAVLGGIAVFGIIGVVYGPLIAMLFMTLYDLYDRVYRPKLARQMAERSFPGS